MDTDPKNDFAHLLDDSGLETDGDQYKKKKPNHNKPMGTLKNTDKSLQAIHNHMLGAHDLSLPDVELDAIIEVVKLAEGERVPDTVNMISQWQPMETMPLDSKARIVYCPSNNCQFMVSWDRHTDEYRHFGTLDSLDYEASHWQNLQKPPTE
jgi:hypothetical protein